MDKWWKDPRLDDEGTYDYLVEELPRDSIKWTKHPCKCDCCDKERKLTQVSTHYFYCYDGWDSISYNECWKCYMKGISHTFFYNIKENYKREKSNRKLWKELKKENTKENAKKLYEILKQNLIKRGK